MRTALLEELELSRLSAENTDMEPNPDSADALSRKSPEKSPKATNENLAVESPTDHAKTRNHTQDTTPEVSNKEPNSSPSSTLATHSARATSPQLTADQIARRAVAAKCRSEILKEVSSYHTYVSTDQDLHEAYRLARGGVAEEETDPQLELNDQQKRQPSVQGLVPQVPSS